MLTMDQGGDINWAAVSVKLSIDGAAPVTCDNPGVDGTSVCSLVEFGNTDDQVWSVGDGVTVVENGRTSAPAAVPSTSPSRTPVKARPSTPPTASLLSDFNH